MRTYYLYDISRRVLDEADYITETGATVRTAAEFIGVSKSTVHKDMTQRLKNMAEIDVDYQKMYETVQEVLQQNKAERHLRGGEATKIMYGFKRCK